MRSIFSKITYKPEISHILHLLRTNGVMAQWKEKVTSNCLDQECHTRRRPEATLHVWNCAEGRMQFLIWRSPLLRMSCNVAQSEVDLQRKMSLPFSISTPYRLCLQNQTFVRGSNFAMLPQFIKKVRIISLAALKGFEGREFDTPDLDNAL